LALATIDLSDHSHTVATIVTLILVGAALLALETVLPGFIAGLVGFGCLVAAVYMAYADFGLRTGNIVLGVVGAGLIAGALAWMKWLPDSRVARRFVSRGQIGGLGNERPDLIDQTGTALTTLRPSGTALINNRRVDVVTEGQLVEPGTPVRVVAIEGLRVVVRPQSAGPEA
jgi:membrane-bound serine protease (ClpP class)